MSTKKKMGVIVIGRNEGKRLSRTFSSIPRIPEVIIIYVDSGSSDNSIEIANEFNIPVHKLDSNTPFSPSRARKEGVEILLEFNNSVEYIFFLDGDCELTPEWLNISTGYLENNKKVAIVCGLLEEAYPEASIYNKISPQKWKLRIGEIESCGGIFLIRRTAYIQVGGFNPKLITREEQDLCDRIRKNDWKIVRLGKLMVRHDSGYEHFSQWWFRALWGGFGDALLVLEKNSKNNNRLFWYLLGPLFSIFLFILSCTIVYRSFCIALFILIILFMKESFSAAKIFIARRREGDSFIDAIVFSFFNTIRNFACGLGFLWFIIKHTKKNSN